MDSLIVKGLVDYLNGHPSYAHMKLERKNGEWRGNRLDPKSDSGGLAIDVTSGAWFDHVQKNGGSIHELAKTVGYELPDDNRHKVDTTKREYKDLADYAQAHGIPEQVLTDAKWRVVTYRDRPAIQFPTATGNRWRYLDGGKQRWDSPSGYKQCWYGFDRAIAIANEHDYDFIVLCNGEISTIVGQHYGLPAFAITGGETAIPENLLSDLKQKWRGRVIVAMDCDDTGRNATEKILKQLPNAVSVDLMLSEHGDLGDFCKLHTEDALKNLRHLSDSQNPIDSDNDHATDQHRSDHAICELSDLIHGRKETNERAFPFPIAALRKYGGFLKNCTTGKVCLIAGGTGTGKTQLMETFCDKNNRIGVDGHWHGDEWTKREMMMRRVQRYSGQYGDEHITYDMIQDHLTYLAYECDGVAHRDNFGVKMTASQLASFEAAKDYILKFKGTMEYFGIQDSLEDTFESMKVALERERRNNRKVLFVVFDYLQLLKVKSYDASVNRFEYAFERVKKFAMDYNVYVYMPTQVNKQNQSDMKDGKVLGIEAAHYVRGDKANLFLTLNRMYTPSTDDYGNDLWLETPCFWLNSGKSSLGGNSGKPIRVPLMMDYNRLKFTEPRYNSQGTYVDGDWTKMQEWSHVKGNIYYQGDTDNSTRIENIPFS